MAANWRDGRWHVVKAFPKPFVWLRRNWLALRWDGEAWERYGQWYSRERAEEEVRMLNDTEDWIDALHSRIEGRFDSFDPLTGELFDMKIDTAPSPHWINGGNAQRDAYMGVFDVRPDQPTFHPPPGRFQLAYLDRQHLGCG